MRPSVGPPRRRVSARVRRNRTIVAAAVALGAMTTVLIAVRPAATKDIVPSGGTVGTVPKGDDTSGTLPPITPAVPGLAEVVGRGPTSSNAVALTIDDGDCESCVGGIVSGIEKTGAHVTLCPNGVYGPRTWEKYAARIKMLITKSQVTICNHTWDHKNLVDLSPSAIREELTRNEQWIEDTFGVTARPYFRPPYGSHNATVDRVAATLGYTKILLWTGTLGDSITHPTDFLLNQMQLYAKPGTIILGHANHPPTAEAFSDLIGVVQRAGVRMVTVSELFGSPTPPP